MRIVIKVFLNVNHFRKQVDNTKKCAMIILVQNAQCACRRYETQKR